MKKITIISCVLIGVYIAATAFSHPGDEPRRVILKRHKARQQNILQALQVFSVSVHALDGSAKTQRKVKEDFMHVRSAFKQWEYMGEYLDPVWVKDYINGAPLPKLERNSFGLNIIDPRGLQQLDDLVFSDNLFHEKEEIIKETKSLQELFAAYSSPAIYDRHVFEAMRIELVRIYTLGLTGFDVPGSGNAIPDAKDALQTMREDISLYERAIAKEDQALAERIVAVFDACIVYLDTHTDFDKLDRLHILKTYINPLYADLLMAHQLLGIETMMEVADAQFLLPPHNYASASLFANDFLDPSRYMAIPPAFYRPAIVELGKMLFFDPVLSVSNERACASCHNPAKGFADGNPKSLAMGMNGTVKRNAPTLINSVYSERFFHDMRAGALEDQIEHVIVNEKEFNTQIFDIISKLSKSDEYVALFDESFKDYMGSKINRQTISFAIAAYVSSLRGFNSPFDKYVRGEAQELDASVKRGFNLFMGKAACGTCHFAPVFNGTVPPRYEETESEVLGVPQDPYVKKPVVDRDEGRGIARLNEGAPFYKYSFKTPTVRNIALTAPYMHNGAYKTLEDVMDFYNKGGGKGLGIIIEHQTLPFDKLDLSKREIKDIVAFMKALTDTMGMTSIPARLPQFSANKEWNSRKVGGVY